MIFQLPLSVQNRITQYLDDKSVGRLLQTSKFVRAAVRNLPRESIFNITPFNLYSDMYGRYCNLFINLYTTSDKDIPSTTLICKFLACKMKDIVELRIDMSRNEKIRKLLRDVFVTSKDIKVKKLTVKGL